jgi:hypothetical protein
VSALEAIRCRFAAEPVGVIAGFPRLYAVSKPDLKTPFGFIGTGIPIREVSFKRNV